MGVGVLSRANQKFPGGEQGQRGNQKWGRGRRVRERSSAIWNLSAVDESLDRTEKKKGRKIVGCT